MTIGSATNGTRVCAVANGKRQPGATICRHEPVGGKKTTGHTLIYYFGIHNV